MNFEFRLLEIEEERIYDSLIVVDEENRYFFR